MDNIFNVGNNWYLSGISSTWTGKTWLTDSLEEFNKVINIRDNYFNYQKCISGVTYTYTNSLYNIYNKDINTSELNLYKQNLYNEFDIIDTYMQNFKCVDICTLEQIDFNKIYTKLDNTLLKTNMRLLIINQSDKTKNGIYKINNNGNIIVDDDLTTIDKSFRYSTYVKNGIVNKDKQFFLVNSGLTFPTTYEEKTFVQKESYIIKNSFVYNIFQTGITSDIVPRLIFTDYEIARKSLGVNSELYNTITESFVTEIKYDMGLYDSITIDTTINDEITNDLTDLKFDSGYTVIDNSSLYTYVGEYVLFSITSPSLPSDTYLLRCFTYLYQLKDIGGNDYTQGVGINQIPTYILSDIISKYDDCVYTINIGSSDNKYNVENMNPFSRFMYYSGDTDDIVPKNDSSFYYIDFCDLSINGTYFTTDNIYIKYKLYDHLNTIDNVKYTAAYNIKTPPSSIVPSSTGLTSGSTYIQINTTDTDYFVKNTFVYVNEVTDNVTLVKDIVDGQYIIIESGTTWSFSNITHINVDYNLKNVSDMLYYLYKNKTVDSFFRKVSDNEKREICGAYGDILSSNSDINISMTGIILYINNRMELRLFNTESYYNNGKDETSITMDINMIYKPIDVLKVGYDKKTMLPIPVFDENIESLKFIS